MNNNPKFLSRDLPGGLVDAVLARFRSTENMRRFVRGELSLVEPNRPWTDREGMVTLSVTSEGLTGKKLIEKFRSKGIKVDKFTNNIAEKLNFTSRSGLTTRVVILKSKHFPERYRFTKNVRSKAKKMLLSVPSPEVAFLIRDMITDGDIEAMGLNCILTMHEPVHSCLLASSFERVDVFGARYDSPGCCWHSGYGFAFVLSEVNLQVKAI